MTKDCVGNDIQLGDRIMVPCRVQDIRQDGTLQLEPERPGENPFYIVAPSTSTFRPPRKS